MNILLLVSVFFPILGGLAVFFIKGLKSYRAMCIFTAVIALLTAVSNCVLCFTDTVSLTLWEVNDTIAFVFTTDNISRLFTMLMTFMFVLVLFYSFDYMKHDEKSNRFFGFYLCVMGVLAGIYFSSNLITMYMFYEMMTLLSLPLVLHTMTKEAVAAGLKYLFYSIGGAVLSLTAVFYLYNCADSTGFTPGGFLTAEETQEHPELLLAFVMCAIIGFGCKAGLFPLHDWLPTAHPIAPGPASALLSGIITKSGVVAIIRVVFYSVGVDFIRGTWVQYTWMILALFTVFMGSMLAYREKYLKKRLAFSTVSQVSYVLFGLSLMHPVAFVGALLHVVFHSTIKIDLFLVAGSIIHNTGCERVDELKAIGKKMPISILSFTFASLALIGIPPACGFVSKWMLAEGALSSGIEVFAYLGSAVLLVSALLTAGYLLPVPIDGFFPGSEYKDEHIEKCEPKALSLVPIAVLGILTLVLGIFPGPLTNFLETIVTELCL